MILSTGITATMILGGTSLQASASITAAGPGVGITATTADGMVAGTALTTTHILTTITHRMAMVAAVMLEAAYVVATVVVMVTMDHATTQADTSQAVADGAVMAEALAAHQQATTEVTATHAVASQPQSAVLHCVAPTPAADVWLTATCAAIALPSRHSTTIMTQI